MPEETEQDDSKHSNSSNNKLKDPIAVDLKRALFGGIIAASTALMGSYITGRVGGTEAISLLKAILPTTRFLASALMTASATILALMLTLLTLSHSSSSELKATHYRRVKQIAWIDSVGFVAATIFLMLLNMPLEEGAEQVPNHWFSTIYYFVLITSAILGGIIITVVLMLYNSVKTLIKVVNPEAGDPSLAKTEDD